MPKPILCVDFDGVIHSYTSGWKGVNFAPDPPVAGAAKFIMDARRDFDVQIYSSRSKDTGGIVAMRQYIYAMMRTDYGYDAAEDIRQSIQYPTQKPPAFLTLDDRAICFNGTFPTNEEMRNFKPWNKR